MAKLSIGDKARRVLDFMLGVRHRRVRKALAAHGFTEQDLQQGWALLSALTAIELDGEPAVIDPGLVSALDAWENRWFPIAQVVLRTNFPRVHAFVFRNLSQTEGPEVVVSVSTLLDRLDAITSAADESLAAEGRAARKHLEKRGLDDRVIAEARALLTQIGTMEEGDAEEPRPPASGADAEEKLWSWYLEWSGIARVAIRDRRLLRALGFLRGLRKGAIEEEVVTDEDVVTPTPGEPNEG